MEYTLLSQTKLHGCVQQNSYNMPGKKKDLKIEFAEIDLIREHKMERKHWLGIGEITIKALLP